MNDTTVTVRASHEEHHPAERGTVALAVMLDGASRDDVVVRVAALAARVRESIAVLHSPTRGPVTWWSADPAQTWGARPWNSDGKQMPIVYKSRVEISVKFSDMATLAAWVETESSREGVNVIGTTWTLTERTRDAVTERVRTSAVRAAAEKARGYAAGLGLEIVSVLEVADVGLLAGVTSSGVGDQPAMAAMRGAGGAQSEAPAVKPEDITVAASVDARFLARPGAGAGAED
jgi:hypothetical protein